jgi:hypothetical protein
MSTTLEDLEKRVATLEQGFASLRQLLERRPAEEAPAERGARLLREAKASQAAVSAAAAKAFAEMGIPEQPPVSVEELRRMMIEQGVRPEDNAASREIIAMREE